MKASIVPFNELVGLKAADDQTRGILQLDDKPEYGNHIGTVHASAQYALAEATSGRCMLTRFASELSTGVIPVVRNVQLKYTAPAKGKLYSRAEVTDEQAAQFLENLQANGKAALHVAVNIVDEHGTVTMTSTFEWLVRRLA
jgi:hypothetical protein